LRRLLEVDPALRHERPHDGRETLDDGGRVLPCAGVVRHDVLVRGAEREQQRRGEHPGAILAGCTVERGGARRARHDGARLHDPRCGAVEHPHVETFERRLVDDVLLRVLERGEEGHVVVGDRHRSEGAAPGEVRLGVRAQVDNRREAALDEVRCRIRVGRREVVGANREAGANGSAGNGDPAEVAQVDRCGEGQVDSVAGHVILFLMMALAWSMIVTSTIMQMTMANRWPYSYLFMAVVSSSPMPPAPTSPRIVAPRTLPSNRSSV